MTNDQISQIVEALRAQRKAAYREDQERAERLSEAIDKVQDWSQGKIVGPLPIDLGQYGLEHLASEPEPAGASAESQLEPSASFPAARPSEIAEQIDQKEKLRRQAREAEQRGDQPAAEGYWRELLALAPHDLDAQKALQQRTAALTSQTVRKKLADVRAKAKESQSIRELEEAIQGAQELLSSADLDDSTYVEVQGLEGMAKRKRADLKAKSGEIETMAGLGQLKEAIKELEASIRLGRNEIEDREGNIVPAYVKLTEYNQAYALFCTQKAKDYLARAEQSLPAFPKTASERLDEALSQFDKADPEIRADLEARRAEVGELITRWENAQTLIGQAHHEANPERSLALLEDARTHYAGVEDLDAKIALARADAAVAIVQDIRIIYANTNYLLSQANLDEAQQTAIRARERAKDVRGASALLEEELQKVDQLIAQIAQQAAIRRLAGEAEASIQVFLERRDYASAAQRIELLSDEVRKQESIKTLEGRIARERGAETTYRLAETRFSAGDWEGVVTLFDPKSEQADGQGAPLQMDSRMEDLRRRASARLAYQQGVDVLHDEPITAERSFELARLTDPTLSELVQPYLVQIAAWKGQATAVRSLLADAEKLEQGNRLDEAYGKLSQAKEADSPLRAEALERWMAVRAAWHKQLLAELATIPGDSPRTAEIIKLLRGKGLLDSPEDQKTVATAELGYHRSRAEKAANPISPRWQEAKDAWASYLKLDPDAADAQDGLRQASREVALAEGRRTFAATKDKAATLSFYDLSLEDDRLQTDPLYLGELVRQACQFEDFVRARQYLATLRQVDKPGSPLADQREQFMQESQAWAEARQSSKASFDEGRYLAAVSTLTETLQAKPGAEASGLWQKERDEVQGRAVKALLEKARELRRQVSGPGRTEVISLYSQAIQLGGADAAREATTAIEEIKSELPDLVRVVVDEAERYSPDNSDPMDAQRETERQLTRLNDFRQVTNYMGADGQKWRNRIDDAARKLGTQNDTLRKVNKLLFDVRNALRDPKDDSTLAGADSNLKQAKSAFPRAAGINDLQGDLAKTKADRAKARQLVEQLKAAAQDEENPGSFRGILEAGRGLRQLDPDDRFRMQQSDNLLVYYNYLNRNVDTLEEHEQLARDRQENYRIYQEWQEKSAPYQERLAAALAEAQEKRSKGSLEEQQEAYSRVLELCASALEAYARRPTAPAQSYPVQDILDLIDKWTAQTEKEEATFAAELRKVQERREARDKADEQLLKLLAQKPVTANRSAANRRLEELGNLDPNWSLLAARTKKTQEWQAPKPAKFPFGGR